VPKSDRQITPPADCHLFILNAMISVPSKSTHYSNCFYVRIHVASYEYKIFDKALGPDGNPPQW
jgi:hypothetical protein